MPDPRYNVADRVNGQRLSLSNGAHQKIVVDWHASGIYEPLLHEIRLWHDKGMVYFSYGPKVLEMRTPVAAKVGFAICKNGGAAQALGGVVSVQIDNDRLVLLPESAVQLGGVMLRKADKADDWQRANLTPREIRK